MTTPVPPEITTPDTLETCLGTSNFKYGMPDQATIETVNDNIDFAPAVGMYLNNIRAISIYSYRKRLPEAGVEKNTVCSAARLNDYASF